MSKTQKISTTCNNHSVTSLLSFSFISSYTKSKNRKKKKKKKLLLNPSSISNRMPSQPQLINNHMERIMRLRFRVPHQMLCRRHTRFHQPLIPTFLYSIQHPFQTLNTTVYPHKHRHL
ncbi:hypothetical protein HanRHA438_Chr14g0676351 [Helianthus annuus]|nr:hypothetical protein HanRHA438_Chr14g0676351 [Helianthus annuus]